MPGILACFFFCFCFFFFSRPLGEHPRNYNCSATKLLFGYVHTTPDCFCAATKSMQGFCSHLTGMIVAARFLWRNEADLHISDRFVPYFGAGRKTVRTVAEINRELKQQTFAIHGGQPELKLHKSCALRMSHGRRGLSRRAPMNFSRPCRFATILLLHGFLRRQR